MSSSVNNTIESTQPLSSEEITGQDEDKFQTAGVVTMASAHAVHDTYTGFLPALYPELISKLSISNAQAGLMTFFIQGASIIQPFIGYLADRTSLKYLVVLTPAVTAILMSLLGKAPSFACGFHAARCGIKLGQSTCCRSGRCGASVR